ncbi:MAG: hypothetical protein M1832_000492 [Thelocarpon impressellum]|nr:MAG: hypothetical protein M1832_000492 [Thelocarpon impressellum]
MALVPVIPPPPGTASNFDNPESLARIEITFAIICPLFALFFVGLRLSSKIWLTRALGWDDYASGAAMAFAMAFSAGLIKRVEYGFGKHLWNVPQTTYLPQMPKWLVACGLLSLGAVLFAKLSILFLYLRIFQVHRKVIYVTHGLILLAVGYVGSASLALVFGCNPIRKLWDPLVPGKCIDAMGLATFFGAMNVVTDFAIFVIPLPLLWRMELQRRTKIALWIIFGAGAFVCGVSVLRLDATLRNKSDKDITWGWVRWDIASLFEMNVGILCGCMPAIKPLVQRFLPFIIPPSRKASYTYDSAFPSSLGDSRNESAASNYAMLASPPHSKAPLYTHWRGDTVTSPPAPQKTSCHSSPTLRPTPNDGGRGPHRGKIPHPKYPPSRDLESARAQVQLARQRAASPGGEPWEAAARPKGIGLAISYG